MKRVLGLWDLIYYGVILTSPIAVVPIFGEAQVLSQGHAIITLLAAMVAMTATAVSFGRMATVYPSAGSVYTYVSRGFNSQIGFIVGWAMFLEYLIQPLQNSLYTALTLQRLVPAIPFPLLSAIAVGFMTLLCWFGIRTTARTNQIMLAFIAFIMAAFIGQADLVHLCASALAGIDFQPAFVRSENFQRARHWAGDSLCREHLYRIRWGKYFGGRSRESQAQCAARDRSGMCLHRTVRGFPGVSGAAGLARLPHPGQP